MRVRFEWMADPSLVLPMNYHQILQGVIYHCMRNEYGHSTFIHDNGYQYGQRKFRMFCFSHILGHAYAADKQLTFTGPVAFEVSSPDVWLIRMLAECVERNGLCLLGQKYEDVNVLFSDFEVETERIIVNAISPITVYETDPENGRTHYFSPEDERFAAAVSENFFRKYAAYYGVPAQSNIRIRPLCVQKKDKCVTQYKGIYINGYGGVYEIKGERKYLNFLYQTGVGSKNAQGFGMIDIME